MDNKKPNPGGVATALVSRKRALDRYYAAPNHCQHCGKVIPVPDNRKAPEIRKKKFCGHSCAAKHNNRLLVAPKRQAGPLPLCKKCRSAPVTVGPSGRKNSWCAQCRNDYLLLASLSPKIKLDRIQFCSHARYHLLKSGRPQICARCGYDKHVECCHIQGVATFEATATISEINALTNLAWLCRNCHWEFDHGMWSF